jgi:adenylate kinase family enzyme
MEKQTFIFMGRSGCGKGTQADLLQEFLKKNDSEREILYIETGKRFRSFISQDSYSSQISRSMMEKGVLQPEFLAIYTWTGALIEGMKEDEHLIIDGTPRKLHEAEVLDTALQFYKRGKPHFIFMNVSREWSEERLKNRGRGDDAVELIQKRSDWYDTDVVPAINYFRDNSNFHFLDINGEQTIEEVHQEILIKLQI